MTSSYRLPAKWYQRGTRSFEEGGHPLELEFELGGCEWRPRTKMRMARSTARIIIVFIEIRCRRGCESFCHVRVIKPDTDVTYPVQRPIF
jgi:hypothetical protein